MGQAVMEYRGFNVIGDGTFGSKLIRQKGSGALPASLGGSFTHATFAHKAIDAYLDTPKTKVKVNAKANDNSGS